MANQNRFIQKAAYMVSSLKETHCHDYIEHTLFYLSKTLSSGVAIKQVSANYYPYPVVSSYTDNRFQTLNYPLQG